MSENQNANGHDEEISELFVAAFRRVDSDGITEEEAAILWKWCVDIVVFRSLGRLVENGEICLSIRDGDVAMKTPEYCEKEERH